MYQHIMAPLDGSEQAECVLPHVETIATSCSVARVTLVRVVEPLRLHGGIETGMSPEARHHLEADSMEVATSYLEERARQLADKGVTAGAEVLFGHVLEQLVDFVVKNGVDLIIVATHGRSGVSRLFLGSVAERLLRASPVPALMVRAPGSIMHRD